MRIGINAMILGPTDTGVGIWTRGLIRALAGRDDGNQYVVYHRRGCAPELPAEARNVRLVPAAVPRGTRLARIAWEQSALPRHARRDALDVLHCPAYVMPRRATVPTVVTLHDLFIYTHPQYCKRLNVMHFRLTLPPSLRQAAVLHCTSHWTRGVLCAAFPQAASRARVVHPGIDDLFRPPDPARVEQYRREKGLPERPFLFVGNVEPKKNVGGLLRAFALLKHQHGSPSALLLAGGNGSWGVAPQRLIRDFSLREDVVRLGYVPREELPLLYASALALVFPSHVEGFGLPPLEAMACGTPVITSGKGGLGESVGGAALIVRDPDPAALAEMMRTVEGNAQLRDRYRRAGLRRADAFRWDHPVAQMLDLYGEAAGERKS